MFAYVRRSIRSFAVVAAAALVLAGASACSNPLKPSDYGIEVTDLVVGPGTEVKTGRGATVHYTLWLLDDGRPERKGTFIESNVDGAPFSFVVGYSGVISGWHIGVPGMKVGGTRRLVIPPEYAYGGSSNGQIPANSWLVFEIELVGIY